MTDGEIVTAIASFLAAGGGSVLTLGRWLGGVWRDIRREEMVAAKEAAAAQRAESNRMIDALLEQARSSATLAVAHATLAGKIDGLSHQLDAIVERTPIESAPIADAELERRRRDTTAPISTRGYRPPRPGPRDD